MATPPQAGKMAPERPLPALIETGKSYPKTGSSAGEYQPFSPLDMSARRKRGCANRNIAFHEALYDARVYTEGSAKLAL